MKVGELDINIINTISKKQHTCKCTFCGADGRDILHLRANGSHINICEDCLKGAMVDNDHNFVFPELKRKAKKK